MKRFEALRWAVALAALLFACAPQPTATPNLLPPGTDTTVPTGALPATPTLPAPTSSPIQPTVAGETPVPSPLPTARAHQYEDVDQAQILAAVFPGLTLTEQPDGYQVQGSQDWTVWVNDRDEGHITQAQREELIAVIANQVGSNPPAAESPYGAAADWLVVMERLDGKLTVTQKQVLQPPTSPLAIDVRIERVVDVDHDGQDEVLVTTNTVQALIIRTEAHLYRWNGSAFVELWKGLELNDNTAAVNQTAYSVYEATIDFANLYGTGSDAIIANGKTTTYPKDSEGRADLNSPSSVTTERTVYKWDGQSFVLDPGMTTPAVPSATQTP